MLQTPGALASRRWLEERGLRSVDVHWYVEIELRPRRSERTFVVDLAIYTNEWGIAIRCDDKVSTLRVTDEPFVHGRDDFNLLRELTTLERIGVMIQALEDRHGIELDRAHARISSNLGTAQTAVRRWLRSWSAP